MLKTSDDISIYNFRTYYILRWVGISVGLIFLILSLGLFAIGRYKLAALFVACLAVWLFAIKLNSQGKYEQAIVTYTLTALVCIIFNIVVLGWETRFYYFLLVLLILVLYHPKLNLIGSFGVVASFTGIYFLCYFYYKNGLDPILDQRLIEAFHIFNTFSSVLIVGGITYYFRESSNKLEEKLRVAANTDIMTGLLNRRSMNRELSKHHKLNNRHGVTNVLMLIDIDHFKMINDKYGHLTGDTILIEFATILKDRFRETDRIARWGGEEFLVLMPFTKLKDASGVADSLRKSVENHAFIFAGEEIQTTFTAGVCELQTEMSITEALIQVDKNLYKGKKAGRNLIIAE